MPNMTRAEAVCAANNILELADELEQRSTASSLRTTTTA